MEDAASSGRRDDADREEVGGSGVNLAPEASRG